MSSQTMIVSLVERCWSVAGAVSTVLAALGRAEPRADVLTRASGTLVDRRADLYTIDPHALRCIAEDVEREMEELVAELASHGRPDLDEDVIAEAARMDLREHVYRWDLQWVHRRRCPMCKAPSGRECVGVERKRGAIVAHTERWKRGEL